ncbi:MAG: DUF177 domain-containing protein [Gemmatimonadota bacterium]
MHLDLSRLKGGRLRQSFVIPRGHPLLAGYPAEVPEAIMLAVELTNPSHGTYVMTGELSGTVIEPCRRCLEPVEVELDDRFRVIYQHTGRNGGEDTGDEDIFAIEPQATRIEIDTQVRDRLFVETEPYVVCDEKCRGICPICGANLNETPCACVIEVADPRWEALQALRQQGSE